MRKRYPSNLTDALWELIRTLLPPAKPVGRPRSADLREVVNTLFYQARTVFTELANCTDRSRRLR